MAVVSSKTKQVSDNREEKEEVKNTNETIDLSQLDKLPSGQKHVIDKDADAWERLSPPVPQRANGEWIPYKLKLFPSKDGGKRKEIEQGKPETSYFTMDLECKVVGTNQEDEEFDGATIYCNGLNALSTRMGKRREISTMAGLIGKLGFKDQLKNEMTDLDVLKLFSKILKSEPMIWVKLDWNARSKNDKNNNGFPLDICTTYRDFPLVDPGDEGLGRQFSFKITNTDGGKEEVSGYPFVKEWIGVSLDGVGKGSSGGSSSGGKGKVVEDLGDDEEGGNKIVRGKDDLDFESEG